MRHARRYGPPVQMSLNTSQLGTSGRLQPTRVPLVWEKADKVDFAGRERIDAERRRPGGRSAGVGAAVEVICCPETVLRIRGRTLQRSRGSGRLRLAASARTRRRPRLLRTTAERADRLRADSCFAVAEQSSEEAGPARLSFVEGGRLARASPDACSSRNDALWPPALRLAGGGRGISRARRRGARSETEP